MPSWFRSARLYAAATGGGRPMEIAWSCYAQSLTYKPMKGMLTGPVRILQWSFVRDDQPRAQTCQQVALAIRDEVQDLENAGIGIIQIDEPAFREGLPLKASQWAHYFDWAGVSFRICASGVAKDTQIHTHMCYSEFNDILPAIAAMDADVITIETSRSVRIDYGSILIAASKLGRGRKPKRLWSICWWRPKQPEPRYSEETRWCSMPISRRWVGAVI